MSVIGKQQIPYPLPTNLLPMISNADSRVVAVTFNTITLQLARQANIILGLEAARTEILAPIRKAWWRTPGVKDDLWNRNVLLVSVSAKLLIADK